MINNVVATNNKYNRAFKEFSQPQNGYFLNTPVSVNPKDDKKEKSHLLGKTIAISALVVGFGTLALFSGGLNKGAAKLLDKWRIKLERRMAKGGKLKNFYRFALSKVNSFIEKSGSVNNFTSLKDVACQRIMWGKNGERTYTRNIHEGITRFFDKISRKTVNASYSSTNRKFANLTEYLSSINERILKKHPNNKKVADALNFAGLRIAKVNENLEKGFGVNARTARLKEVRNATDGLFEFFWDASLKDVKNFKSKNMWQTFIAEDYMLPAKMKLANKTGVLRQLITHDISDNYKATSTALNNIQKFVNPKDVATNDIMASLRNNLNKYKKFSDDEHLAQRNNAIKVIKNNLKQLSISFAENSKKYGYNEDAVKSISSYVAEVEDIISKSSKGELQEILTTYKAYLPRNE